jgi:YD repeat-containing protein
LLGEPKRLASPRHEVWQLDYDPFHIFLIAVLGGPGGGMGGAGWTYFGDNTPGPTTVAVEYDAEGKVASWRWEGRSLKSVPVSELERFGGYTLNWPTPGVFDAAAKRYYRREVLEKKTRPGLSIFFFSEPWLQRAPIHYELGGQGTSADPGIKWFWDFVLANS